MSESTLPRYWLDRKKIEDATQKGETGEVVAGPQAKALRATTRSRLGIEKRRGNNASTGVPSKKVRLFAVLHSPSHDTRPKKA